jgi:hypothetical protein
LPKALVLELLAHERLDHAHARRFSCSVVLSSSSRFWRSSYALKICGTRKPIIGQHDDRHDDQHPDQTGRVAASPSANATITMKGA